MAGYVGKDCSTALDTGTVADTRTQGASAVYALLYRGDARAAEAVLQREYAPQILDQDSPRYGAVVNPATPADPNDTVFAAQPWGPILLRYSDRLSPDGLRALRTHAAAALVYFQKHPISVSYTNIHLLTSSEEVILGDVFGDATAQRRGMAGLQQWVAAVRRDGIHEFESPTYFTVDIDALHEGAIFATDAGQRAQFAAALDYVWREVAANLFTPKERIAGGESRSYDMLYGSDAPMEMKLQFAGFSSNVHETRTLRCLDVFSVLQDGGSYAVPSDVTALAAKTPRVVEQRWAADAQATKYTYIADRFAIGSSNEDYDQTDRVAEIDFAGGDERLVPIRTVGDKTGYWFGPTPKAQLDGERRWDHAQTRPATIQFKNLLVVLSDLDGSAADDGGPLTFNVVLPAVEAGISAGGKSVAPDPSLHVVLQPSDVVGVRVGDATAGVRIARADGVNGPAPLALTTSASGLGAKVARVEALQAPRLPAGAKDLRSISLFGVDSGPGAAAILQTIANARVRSNDDGGTWNVDVSMGGHEFAARYDLVLHKALSRTVDGNPVTVDAPLSVNGSAISF